MENLCSKKMVKFSLKSKVAKVRKKRKTIRLRIHESVLEVKTASGLHMGLELRPFGSGLTVGESGAFRGGTKIRMRKTLSMYMKAPQNMLSWKVGSASAIWPPIRGPMMKPSPLIALKVPRIEARSLLGVMSAR